MRKPGTLRDAFLDGLRDAYNVEKQLLRALRKMARKASSQELSGAFESHLEETQGHIDKLEQAFGLLNENVRATHCDGIAGIIEEGTSVMQEDSMTTRWMRA